MNSIIRFFREFLESRSPTPQQQQLVTTTNTSRSIRDQVLLALVTDELFTQEQANRYRISGDVNEDLRRLYSYMTRRGTKRPAQPTISEDAKRVNREFTIGHHKVTSEKLFSDYTAIQNHVGTTVLFVSNDGTHVLDFENGTVINNKFRLMNPVKEVVEVLEEIGKIAYDQFLSVQEKKFVNYINETITQFKKSKTNLQTGRSISTEIILLETIFSASNMDDLEKKLGSELFRSVIGVPGSNKYKVYESLYSVRFKPIIDMALQPGGIDNLKRHLSYLQIDAMKKRLTNPTLPLDEARMKRIAIADLVITLLSIGQIKSEGTQTYFVKPKFGPRRTAERQEQAVSANIDRMRQQILYGDVAQAAAQAARERDNESPAAQSVAISADQFSDAEEEQNTAQSAPAASN